MYLRFISPLRTNVRGVNLGIFGASFEVKYGAVTPEYLRAAVIKELDWYSDHLHSPAAKNFKVKSRKTMRSVGICWFKSDAREMIRHGFTLKALLEECGYFITTQGTHNPGQILYQDTHQIIAKPYKTTPTCWG